MMNKTTEKASPFTGRHTVRIRPLTLSTLGVKIDRLTGARHCIFWEKCLQNKRA